MLDPRISRLKTPEDCEQVAKHADAKGERDLARQARRFAVELRAERHGAKSDIEREAVRCIYAFEEARAQETGVRRPASRTWQSVKRNGILATVEKKASDKSPTMAYDVLVRAGLEDFTFEAVVLKYPEAFSPAAVAQSRVRIGQLRATTGARAPDCDS
jgi:hypothetical protein